MMYIQKALGIHHIRTKLYSIPLSRLNTLFEQCKYNSSTDPQSAEYKLAATIMDISQYILYKPVQTCAPALDRRKFLNIKFENKGIEPFFFFQLNHKAVALVIEKL